MKLFLVAAILGVCVADRLDNKYLPPRGNSGAGTGFGGNSFGAGFGAKSQSGFGGSGGFGQGSGAGFGGGFGTQHSGNAYNAGAQYSSNAGAQYSGNAGAQYNGNAGAQYSGRQNSADAGAQILRSNSEVTAEGFSYDFETSNGIRADAQGVATNGVQSQGSFGYKGDDGQDYSITYTADENGYQPQGAHLPTPPPIPEAILKSLEQNARDEAAGISDDGTYRGEGAGAGAGGYSGYSQGSGPSSQYGAPARQAAGIGSGSAGFGSGSAGFGSGSGSFGSGSGSFGSGSGSFGARGSPAASRQYLAPNAGPRGSGNGNFNAQSGYKY